MHMFSSLMFDKCLYDPNFKAQAFKFYKKFVPDNGFLILALAHWLLQQPPWLPSPTPIFLSKFCDMMKPFPSGPKPISRRLLIYSHGFKSRFHKKHWYLAPFCKGEFWKFRNSLYHILHKQ